MSRCFPFPPPGYERKLDDADMLKKEKRKEKKHKKDKKDREKRDRKEKREDKEKKEKHRENKKDNEKRVDPQFGSQNGDPLLQNNEHDKQKDGFSGHKKTSVQPQNGEHKELLIGKEEYVHSWGQNEKKLVNRIKTQDIDNSKFVQEFGRRIREEEKRTGSLQFPVESRKSNVDRGEIRKMDGQGIKKKSTFDRIQNTINGKNTHESVKEKNELTKAEWDKNKYMKNGETVGSFNNLSTSNTPNVGIQHSGSELKKRKDMEINGFSRENEPRPNKTARPISSILTENGRKQDFLQNPGLSQPGKSTKVDTKERKVNGAIASQPISKKPPIATTNHTLVKPTSTISPPVNTGHIPSQPLPVPTSRPPSSIPNHITNKPLPISSTKPSQPLHNSKTKESIRPPHPDTKYLKQILAVPELTQWSGLDNQEWLFSSKDYPHFKEKAGKNIFLHDNKEVEVWSEAKQLESVDICALPYVIPY
ncbi:hypothetical protein L1987_33447 [Smallanthus sonchifolius]|uniref:Uncharacterized protein n=1 Tax=Smallanthus sonchifolius TaxID=185202 RepID=A0ACB9HRV9_9ASTR|nr:hypothetical protein L1987_33447 [Smallanthus sonchifolius]